MHRVVSNKDLCWIQRHQIAIQTIMKKLIVTRGVIVKEIVTKDSVRTHLAVVLTVQNLQIVMKTAVVGQIASVAH